MNRSNQLLTINDTPGQYPNSYYAASANALTDFPTLTENTTADICIIGGGLTGLSAAYHAAKLGFSVVLIEANRVGWGASGRNGGQIGTGQRVEQDELEKQLGQDMAKTLWDMSLESVQLCKDLIREHNIDCDLKAGIFHADHRARYSKHSQQMVEKLQRDYDYHDIEHLDKQATRDMIGSKAYYSSTLDHRAAHCHPLNFSLGLADAAAKAGVQIFENTVVEKYSEGSSVIVTTKNGHQVKANSLLLCCNGYLGKLSSEIARHVMPINNFIIATEPLPQETIQTLIANQAAVADSKFVVSYYRISADNRLLFGGGETVSYQFPRDIKSFVQKNMLKIYPQLQQTKIDYGWGGTLAITVPRMPYFKRLQGNILTASGYSGHGLAMSTYAGKLMAEAINGNLTKFDIMADIPQTPFPGGDKLRWPFLLLGMTYYSIRDKF